jgi:exportin-2 (importin alpha re-exporter)
LFTKLDSNPSESFKTRLVRFYHLVSAKGTEAGLGADYFIKYAEQLKGGIFTPIYLTVILTTTTKFARPVDRKLGVISYTKTLCESQAFAQKYQKGWGFTCNRLLELLKNAPQVSSGAGDEIVTEADVDDIGFGVGFTPLNTCKRGTRDDFPEVENVQQWVGSFIKQADGRQNGAIAGFIDSRLEPQAKEELLKYLQ